MTFNPLEILRFGDYRLPDLDILLVEADTLPQSDATDQSIQYQLGLSKFTNPGWMYLSSYRIETEPENNFT